jgi:hypothetical protein
MTPELVHYLACHVGFVLLIFFGGPFLHQVTLPISKFGLHLILLVLFDQCHCFIFCLLASGCIIILLKTKLHISLDHNLQS